MAKPSYLDRTQNKLYEDVAVAATSIVLDNADGFGSTYHTVPFCVIVDPGNDSEEVMLVTAVNTVTNTLTVERDMLGTTDVAHKKHAIVKHYGTPGFLPVKFVDVSTAETVTLLPPKCVILRFATCLGGTIATADAVITMSKGAQAITNGEITIAYDGSDAGDIDIVYPTAYTEFNGTTDYLSCVSAGASTNTFPLVLMCEYIT